MHRQASELKIHEEIEEDDDDLEDDTRNRKIKKASPEIIKKVHSATEQKSSQIDLKKIEESQKIERPIDK